MRSRLWLALVGFVAVPAVRADSTTVTLPSNSFNIVAGTPTDQTVTGVPALTNLLGYTLNANWTSVTGSPISGDLLMGVTLPGGTVVAPGFYGGTDNSNPYTFPGPSLATFGQNSQVAGTAPVNTAAGAFTFTFDHATAATTANLANATVTLFSNPTVATGTTTGGPTAARPISSGTAVSGTGTAVPYSTHTMTVTTAGRYLVALAGTHDTFLTMYGPGGYTPTTPLVNLIAANDDSNIGLSPSVTAVDLLVGESYTVVATGFANSDFGAYTLYGAGPGTVTFNPVPEPTSVVGIGAAALAVGGLIRKRRKAAAPQLAAA